MKTQGKLECDGAVRWRDLSEYGHRVLPRGEKRVYGGAWDVGWGKLRIDSAGKPAIGCGGTGCALRWAAFWLQEI
jgi:hypothetical protein